MMDERDTLRAQAIAGDPASLDALVRLHRASVGDRLETLDGEAVEQVADDDAHAELERRVLFSEVRTALAALSPESREVILLRDVEDVDGEQAAAQLGLTVEAMKSRLHRARAEVREALKDKRPITR